jgi:ribosome biogenesis GTPase
MGKPKKNRPQKKNLKRVDFKRNRAKPGRDKDWTRLHREDHDSAADTSAGERVATKGDLSRKRTVVDDPDAAPDPDCRDGTVITVYGAFADVDDGESTWTCTIRRVLRTLSIGDRNAVTVGDRVRFLPPSKREGVEEEGVIVAIAERQSVLKRVSGRREHIVAANVDQAVIVTSAHTPAPKPHLVDRYIVSALAGNMTPVICLNKIDKVEHEVADTFLKIYKDIGYRTLAVSAKTGDGVGALRGVLANKSTVIAGQSGVGKSSLLNAVDPSLDLAIGDVVEDTRKGRHTTTRSRLIRLAFGGYVVDTPGVKSFDLSCVPRAEIEQYFVEFVDALQHCKFPDCAHIHESGCAIKQAVESGDIDPGRYESYIRLFTDIELRPPSHPPAR